MRSEIFKAAWNYTRELGIRFGYALRRSWAEWKVSNRLLKGMAIFSFQKKDGSIRKAIGTTNLDLIPADQHPKGNKSSDKVICFFDLASNGWKCFSKNNLLIEL